MHIYSQEKNYEAPIPKFSYSKICHTTVSMFYNIDRGIKQGCPISALLFILCAEILAIKIKENKCLKGIIYKEFKKVVKVSQYADDTILFLNNEYELKQSIQILDTFGSLSGLKLNIHKCEGLWLGAQKHLQFNCRSFGIKWPPQIKYLGIYLGHDYNSNFIMNWTKN